MDVDESGRITLRLEKENLQLIDAFLQSHPDYRNRSQLCRDAVQLFIENVTQGGNTVSLQVPSRILEIIDHLVLDGHFNDRQDAIVQALRDHFDVDRLKNFKERTTELQKAKGERIDLTIDGRDEVVLK